MGVLLMCCIVKGLLKNDVRRRYDANEEDAWSQAVSAGSALHAIVVTQSEKCISSLLSSS